MSTKLTSASGAPISDDENSITAGERGPILLQDWHLVEKLAHFARERIPERVVHAKGSGAYGTFTLSKSLSDYTIADYLQTEGSKTEVFLRFSTVGGEMGSADAERDPRGFAVKFYTKEGNHDVVGNNTPVFFLRDPIKFPDFIHTQKRCPMSNLKSAEAVWDFWSVNPQSLHQITILFSDRGVPATYRHMNGYGSHTFSLWNKAGERFWVKWHFKTVQGIKCLSAEDSTKLCGTDPDHAQRDLVESIASGDFPKWRVCLQIMPELDAENYHINPFDLTKVWPHSDYPLIEIGIMELNRNVDNYFAEVEQSAFSPSNLVPGIGASPDKMLQARIFSYPDTQRYRLGVNYNDLPVNCPHAASVNNYQRAGAMAGTLNYNNKEANMSGVGSVNYGPNRKGGPAAATEYSEPPLRISGDADRYDHNAKADNYTQAGDLFRLMNATQQKQLVTNIAGALAGAPKPIRDKMLEHFAKCDVAYAQGIRNALA